MAINILSKSIALGPGSDLWIIPEMNRSIWARRIDWYLNFQLGRATQFQHKPLSPFLHTVLLETEMESSETNMQNLVHNGKLIMIAATDLLPTRYVVAVPDSMQLSNWISAIANIWQNLHRPSIRVFLPEQMDADNFEKNWITQEKAQSDLLLVCSYY